MVCKKVKNQEQYLYTFVYVLLYSISRTRMAGKSTCSTVVKLFKVFYDELWPSNGKYA